MSGLTEMFAAIDAMLKAADENRCHMMERAFRVLESAVMWQRKAVIARGLGYKNNVTVCENERDAAIKQARGLLEGQY